MTAVDQIRRITITAHRESGKREVLEIVEPVNIDLHEVSDGFGVRAGYADTPYAITFGCRAEKVTRHTDEPRGEHVSSSS